MLVLVSFSGCPSVCVLLAACRYHHSTQLDSPVPGADNECAWLVTLSRRSTAPSAICHVLIRHHPLLCLHSVLHHESLSQCLSLQGFLLTLRLLPVFPCAEYCQMSETTLSPGYPVISMSSWANIRTSPRLIATLQSNELPVNQISSTRNACMCLFHFWYLNVFCCILFLLFSMSTGYSRL